MRLTTVRVRPGRREKLEELGVEVDRGKRYAEVSVFGETVAVAVYSDSEERPASFDEVVWLKEDLSLVAVGQLLSAYCEVVKSATAAGLVPA